MAAHSKIVGGSTAKRVMNCPGSVALSATVPPKPSSTYADEGTLLHDVIAKVLEQSQPPSHYLGTTYQGITLTEDLIDRKLAPALAALEDIDPGQDMVFMAEASVGFGNLIPGVFGSADLLGRLDGRAIVLDWKFGDGVMVSPEENEQLLFYAAAARRTPATAWAFIDATEVELIIVQPPYVKRWTTTVERVRQFEYDLTVAVRRAQAPDAALAMGDHCRWCPAKAVCPLMTGAVDRSIRTQVTALNAASIGAYLDQASLIEQWLADVRGLAQTILEAGAVVPGWKMVPKRGLRQWVNEDGAAAALKAAGLGLEDIYVEKIVSPAQAEKLLKKTKQVLPDGLAVSVSSGNTLAPESDPRPSALQIGQQITAALAKMVN
jgi:hypothetical protein